MTDRITDKTVERVSGKGQLLKDDKSVANITYSFVKYQEIHHVKDEEVEGLSYFTRTVSGELLDQYFGENITVLLQDGRRLNGFLKSTLGRNTWQFHVSGDFYKP